MRNLSIRREAAISFGINAALSLAFFLGVFGAVMRPLAWAARDHLAFDFVPQSIAVSLMSALVPALVARARHAAHLAVPPIVLRAVGCALAGGVLGGLLALLATAAALPPIGWAAALPLKLFYGGALGALVTTLVLRRMRTARP